MRDLILIGLFITTMIAQTAAQTEDRSLPIFPAENTPQNGGPFQAILNAYNKNDVARAIQETERLRADPPDDLTAEAAAFLLGDLHLKLAEKGETAHLRQALSAFQEAMIVYPESENTVRALWRTGQTYAQLKLYYESIASFKRVLNKHPRSRFAPLAQLGMAQTYQAWRKWEEAAGMYDQIDPAHLSPEEQRSARLGHADVLYHMEAYEEAYLLYEQVGSREGPSQTSPQALLQYGDAAYLTRHYHRGREIFLLFSNIYPKEPSVPVALARVGDTLRLQGRIEEARQAYQRARSAHSDGLEDEASRLIVAVGEFSLADNDQRRKAQPSEQARLAIQEITEQAGALLHEPTASPLHLKIASEAAEELSRHDAYAEALQIEDQILTLLSPSPFRAKVFTAFQKAASEAVDQWSKNGEDFKLVELFHRYPSAFTPKMLTGRSGLKVGAGHAQIGLYSNAVDLLAPIARDKKNPLSEEALFLLTKTLLQQGERERSAKNLKQFLARYPTSDQAPLLLANFAEMLDHHGETERAVEQYRDWLNRYPRHPDRAKISSKLADAYGRKRDFKNAIGFYLQSIQSDPKGTAGLSLKLADAYYQLGEYRKAVAFYRSALNEEGEDKKRGWAEFQLAMSYTALGQKDQGKSIFARLAQSAEDPLLKGLAAEKTNGLR